MCRCCNLLQPCYQRAVALKREGPLIRCMCQCLQAIRAASAALGGLDGVTTFCEMAVPLVSRLAEALGLPGNTPEAVDAARDKYATRTCLAAAGLPTPRNARISAPADVQPAGQHVGFPAVIKPVSGGSGVHAAGVQGKQWLQPSVDQYST